MSGRRGWTWTPALVAGAWLLLASAAWAHASGAAAGTRHVKLDAGEVAELGADHAREHAGARLLERQARARWKRMTPAQRRQRVDAAARQEKRLNRTVAARPRDDLGVWSGGADGRPIGLPDYAIHVAVLPTGELLYFGRQPLNRDGYSRSNLGSAAIFNPNTGKSRLVPPPRIADNPDAQGNPMPASIYCSGQALLSDGRVLIVGGNLNDPAAAHTPNNAGVKHTFLFDPWTETWERGPEMPVGRWYPTVTKLSSGDFIILSGLDESGQGTTNPRMELYRPDGTTGSLTTLPGGYRGPSLYPAMFTLPNGNVAIASPGVGDSAILDIGTAVDLLAPQGSAWTQILPGPGDHYGGAAALEPQMSAFGGSWQIIAMGGTVNLQGRHLATRNVERLDASPGTETWQPVAPQERLNAGRNYLNNVLLPDGGLVVVGGGSGIDRTNRTPTNVPKNNYYIANPAPPALRQVELRRPGEKTWRLGAAQQEWRTYHSTAALLPDGRIFSGGDDYHEGPDPVSPYVDRRRRDSAEIYWPPYLFNGNACAPRPVIRAVGATAPPANADAAWATLTYGEPFGIFSEHARAGMRAALVAPSQVTHSLDMNQRVVPLKVTNVISEGGLNVVAPAGAGIAPPGWYMLFVIDADGTPSIARWVRLLPAGSSELDGIAAATVTEPWPDPRARTCVNPPDPPTPPAPPPAPPPPRATTKLTAKLGVSHAAVKGGSRRLDVLAGITSRASGKVKIALQAGGRSTSFSARINSARGRIAVLHRIPASQAKLGTGIVTITYDGDDDTRAQSVRLRAARRAARLQMKRPTLIDAGRIRANGTISKRARGVVRVQLQFVHDGATRTLQLSAKISRGTWKLDKRLPAAVRDEIAQRSGTLHSYTLFTGYKRAGIRGEMRSFEVLGAR